MNDPASLTEHVAKIIFDDEDPEGSWARIEDWYEGRLSEQERDEKRKTAKAVLDYVTPLIRAAALEEAAQVADDYITATWEPGAETRREIAAGIRARKEPP